MGNCAGKVKEGEVNKSIEDKLKKYKVLLDNEYKLLLLGSGESGKSTVVKQMRIISNQSFLDDERQEFLAAIKDNVLHNLRYLIFAKQKFGLAFQNPANDTYSRGFLDSMVSNEITLETAEKIESIWNDPTTQEVYMRRNEFQIYDSAEYFFQKIRAVVTPGYVPTDEDILRVRVKTTGITETRFLSSGGSAGNLQFKLFDVGGQRNERKKWIHCFEEVTAVLFVVSLSEYDQVLYEDETQNRMVEALVLFEEICNLNWFEKSSMIIFFNKADIFREKISRVDLSVCFPEYKGGLNYENATKFIADLFVARNRNTAKMVYFHFTTATNTENIKKGMIISKAWLK